jgi:hypothetical protein
VRILVLIIYNEDEHSLLFTTMMNIRYYLQRWWTFVIIYSEDEHSLLFTTMMNIRYYLQWRWTFVNICSEDEPSSLLFTMKMNICYNCVVMRRCVKNELYLVKWTFKYYHEHYFYLTLMYIIIAFICLYYVNALVSHFSWK